MKEYPIDIESLVITEEMSKDNKGIAGTIFYIREKPFRIGYSYQTTAMSFDTAEWVIKELKINREKWLTLRGPCATTSTQ